MKLLVAGIIPILLLVFEVSGQDISSYLILSDINGFIASKNPSAGQGPGILAGAGHFYHDHKDMTYRISYFNLQTRVGPEVQVTQHAGSDSDKWLLHEVERGFRDNNDEEGRLGLLHKGSRFVEISNNKVFRFWSTYRWISNYVVVIVDYSNPRKPEPLEVVQAYLQKFPSTIPAALVLDRAHDEQWIKDEMERRLWLCDKWLLQLQMGKVEENETFRKVVDHLNGFLDYRGKYYGINPTNEKVTLENYLINNDGTSIKNKLTEYKTWWSVNKTKSISLP
jgi:hypothetical protein